MNTKTYTSYHYSHFQYVYNEEGIPVHKEDFIQHEGMKRPPSKIVEKVKQNPLTGNKNV